MESAFSFVTVSQPQGGGDGVCRRATSSPPSVRCLWFVYRYDPSTPITALSFPSTTTTQILQKTMPVCDDHKRRRAQCLREVVVMVFAEEQHFHRHLWYLCFVYRYDPSTSIIALVFPSTTTGWILQKSMPVHDNNKRWRPQCLCETTNLTLQSVQVSCKMLVQRSLYTVTTTLDQVPCEPQMALLPQCREYQLE